jgi:2-dehydropantoate 2-reductase
MSIHILGTGAIGCHVATALKSQKNKVNLLLRSQSHLNDFQSRQNSITFRRKGQMQVVPGFTASVMTDASDKSPITSLIVATKAHHTLKALAPMAPRLSSASTILLLQNGMGVAEELIGNLWPNSLPPKILVGVNRHAVERLGPFDVIQHSGQDDPEALRIGRFPIDGHTNTEPSELLQKILDVPELQAAELPWDEIRVKMYKKLVVNACINPVASMLMSKNGAIIHHGNPGGIAMMRAVCEEAYDVLKDGIPGETVDSLMDMVLRINEDAAENSCSTFQDIRSKRLTEIDYINGYICKLGKEKNINVKSNQALVHLIHAKEAIYDF